MSKRLGILKASLAKKEARFNERLQHHFDTVAQANGQPLNDKRNGRATLNKWDKQSDAQRSGSSVGFIGRTESTCRRSAPAIQSPKHFESSWLAAATLFDAAQRIGGVM